MIIHAYIHSLLKTSFALFYTIDYTVYILKFEHSYVYI
jgi:hypothetical protein